MTARILKKNTVIYPNLSYVINEILFRANKDLGRFRSESQYCDAIEFNLKKKNLSYKREVILPPSFEGEDRGRNRVDFLIEDKIILEVKAKSFLTRNDYYQTKRYLTSLGVKLGILVNMSRYTITPKRVLNSEVKSKPEDYLA